jgi:carbon-monoxide dehydrogenase medium subunit
MSLWKNYFLPHSLSEALEKLASESKTVRLIAGGTDLLIEMQQGIRPPVDALIDVTAIPELLALEIHSDRLFIGGAVPLGKIVASSLVKAHAPALIEACELIGGPQVRNTATLGGNVAHALPAADGTIALIACGAVAEVAGISGRRSVEIADLFLGPRQSQLETRSEILVGFYLPLRRPGEGSAFRRTMRPQGVALPILNMAAWLRREGDSIAEARLAIGPAGPRPVRPIATETLFKRRTLDQTLIDEAYQLLLREVQLRTSKYRASSEYRRHLTHVLLEESLKIAWSRTWDRQGE